MASNVATQHWRCCNKLEMWDHDPDSASATLVTPDAGTTKRGFDMKDFGGFVCAAMAKPLTGNGITKLEIVAYSDSALSANATVVKDSGTVTADAVGDWVIEECTAEELSTLSATAGAELRYLAGRLTLQNSADECTVIYIGADAAQKYLNQTPATTIA